MNTNEKTNRKTANNTQTGRICDIRKNSYTVRFEDKDIPARLKGSFYGLGTERLPVVGDFVKFNYNPSGDSMIVSVHERKNLLQRPDQAKTNVMQYMVANVDYVFIITSLNEDYSYNRIVRYVSIALQANAIPVVILTKSDLCADSEKYVKEAETVSDKVRVHAISALYQKGTDELKEYFRPGVTICLMGSSGAGKSTLINAISGEDIMKTGAVRASDSTGKHTTTNRQLISLRNGVSVIDTPGMREVGMARVEEGLEDTFSDIISLEKCCKFSNCRHESEPGCAIKAAMESGELTEERYMLYKSLSSENIRNYAGKKTISKWNKERRKVMANGFS